MYADRASNGFVYAQTGAIVLSKETAIPGATGSTQFFGYVTANAYYTTGADGTHYIAVPVWNGSENVTVLAKTIAGEDDNTTTATQGDETNFTTGTLVSYLDNNDGTASALATLPVSAAKDAVTAWDNSSVIKFFTAGSGAELTVDDKTVILFINGADRAGVENGNIILADYVDPYDTTEGLYANVYYVKTSAATQPNANDHVDVLVLDTNNRIAKNATESVIVGATKDPAPHTHNFVADKTAADATCTTPGQKATYKCDEDNCPNKETRWLDNKGETEVKDGNDVIAATGHNVTTWAACTDSSDSEHNGTHHSGTCGTCNETVYEAHTFGENAQSGDECTATGCTATKD